MYIGVLDYKSLNVFSPTENDRNQMFSYCFVYNIIINLRRLYFEKQKYYNVFLYNIHTIVLLNQYSCICIYATSYSQLLNKVSPKEDTTSN